MRTARRSFSRARTSSDRRGRDATTRVPARTQLVLRTRALGCADEVRGRRWRRRRTGSGPGRRPGWARCGGPRARRRRSAADARIGLRGPAQGHPPLLSAAHVPAARASCPPDARAGRPGRAHPGGRRPAGSPRQAAGTAGAGRRGPRLPLGATAGDRVGAAARRRRREGDRAPGRRRGHRTADERGPRRRRRPRGLGAGARRRRRRRARPLPPSARLAASRRRAGRLGRHLLLPVLPPQRRRRAHGRPAAEPARRPRVHGLQHLPGRQPDLRGHPAHPRGRPRAQTAQERVRVDAGLLDDPAARRDDLARTTAGPSRR